METQDPRPRLLRRVIIDMLPYSATDEQILEMQERLGLVPSSMDVLALDRKESNNRIRAMGALSPAINTMAGYSAEAIAEFFIMQIDTSDGDDDEHEGTSVPIDHLRKVLVQQNANVIVTAVNGIVSHLIASGILVFNKDKTLA